MKYNILIFSFLVLIISSNSAISDNNYIINDDTVYIEDSKVYLSATPHTLSSSGWVYFNLTSKVYTGNIDVCWGLNTSTSKPTKAEVYSPHWVNTTTNHEKTFYNSTFHVYTGDNLNYGNSYNTNYRYTITESIINDNGTTYITSNAAFNSYTTDGTNYTIYWYTKHDNHYLWKDFSSSFNSVIHDYKGYNKWYYIKNVPITSNKEYTTRAWIDIPVSTEKQSGKYYFAIKPSGETISQAVNNGHFYNLDPWWDVSWSKRKNITLIGNTSGAQTDYQLLLNVTYEPEMQSDFDDLRFCNETYKLDSWLESKVDSFYALVWVEFPTTPVNGVNQTYYMYYGNTGAASNWDIGATFIDGWDYEGDTIGNVPTGWTEDTAHGSFRTVVGKTARLQHSSGEAVISNNYAGITSITGDNNRAIQFTINPAIDPTYNYIIIHDSSGHVDEGIFLSFYDDGNIKYRSGGWSSLQAYDASTDYKIEIYNINLTNNQFDIDINSVNRGTNLEFSASQTTLNYFTYEGSGGETVDENIDNVFVRKYAANPPTYAFGSGEHYIPEGPTTLTEEIGLIISEITSGLKGVNMSNYLVYAFILIGILLIILGIQIITNNIYRG